MISPDFFINSLSQRGIDFFAGVPDSLLKNICAYIADHKDGHHNIIAANEGAAVGLAAGHYLATGHIPVVYMQNSGEGNIINPEIDTIRTITTKQDRNPNSGNLYFDSGIEGKGKFRYLTPRECMLFMGFKDTDYWKLKNNNVAFHKGDQLFSRDKIIRMAGNSIPVPIFESIFRKIILNQTDSSKKENRLF